MALDGAGIIRFFTLRFFLFVGRESARHARAHCNCMDRDPVTTAWLSLAVADPGRVGPSDVVTASDPVVVVQQAPN